MSYDAIFVLIKACTFSSQRGYYMLAAWGCCFCRTSIRVAFSLLIFNEAV